MAAGSGGPDGKTVRGPDQATIRAAFPALQSEVVFLENAGGSQLPASVIEGMANYMRDSYVQLGAGYPRSRRATATVEAAHDFARRLVNSGEGGQVILASSTTVLLNMLAACYGQTLQPGQEIILAESGHEANLGPWKHLEKQGIVLRWWRLDPETYTCPLAGLDELLSDRTALVALPHVSNLLGGIVDLAAVTALAHEAGARVVADGVAYAPHRAIDVQAWDVDWYAFSNYKVYGPHMAILYGKGEALAELSGPNHFFIPGDELPYKFEPGGANHESCAGLLGLGDYLALVAGATPGEGCDRGTVEAAFAHMTAWEEPLIGRLLAYLRSKKGVRVIGPQEDGPDRVGTVSFVHDTLSSADIAAAVDQTPYAIRHGHMYAWHLCEALGLDPEDGVVRISFVHYNTLAEIEGLIAVLDKII